MSTPTLAERANALQAETGCTYSEAMRELQRPRIAVRLARRAKRKRAINAAVGSYNQCLPPRDR